MLFIVFRSRGYEVAESEVNFQRVSTPLLVQPRIIFIFRAASTKIIRTGSLFHARRDISPHCQTFTAHRLTFTAHCTTEHLRASVLTRTGMDLYEHRQPEHVRLTISTRTATPNTRGWRLNTSS